MSNTGHVKLIKELKLGYDNCWKAQISAYDEAKKYASLCVHFCKEYCQSFGYFPESPRFAKRTQETDGQTVLDEDFWSDPVMVIALYEFIEKEFDL